MKLSGTRLDKRDEYLLLRRMRVLSGEEYKGLVLALERAEAGVVKRREKAAQKAQALREEKARLKKVEGARKAEARAQRAREKRQEKRMKAVTLISQKFSTPVDGRGDELYQLAKPLIGVHTTFRAIVVGTGDGNPFNIDIQLDGASLHAFYTDLIRQYPVGSDEEVLVSEVTFYVSKVLRGVRRAQSFRDGLVHCVLDPMERDLKKRFDSYKNKKDICTIKGCLKKVEEYKVKYADGIPEADMEMVAKSVGYHIRIYDILNNELYNFNNNTKKNVLEFINTRMNHVEPGKLLLDSKDGVEVSQEKLQDILLDCMAEGKHYMFRGDPKDGKPNWICTSEGSWKVANPDLDEILESHKENKIFEYAFNASKYPMVNNFIREGCIVNSSNTIVSGGVAIDHLDLKHAYAQFKTKFLGKIHQWGDLNGESMKFVEDHIGIYRCRVSSDVPWFLKKLGFAKGKSYTLPSVEFVYLQKWMAFKVESGVWGEAVDLELGDNMMDDRKLYQLWAGRLGMEYDSQVFMFPSTLEQAEHLVSLLGEEQVEFFEHTQMVRVYREKKVVKTTHHIFAFITANTRINLLEKMSEVGFENVSSVVLDGIYLLKEVEEDALFRKKPITEKTSHTPWYKPSVGCMMPLYNEMFLNQVVRRGVPGNAFLAGQGGSGKTHWALTCGKYNDILYISPTRALGIKMREKYGVSWDTLHRLIGLDGERKKTLSWKDKHGRAPSVVLLDELTMCEKSMVEKAIEMYPGTLFLLAGDMEGSQWFQCRSGDGITFASLYDVSSWETLRFEKDWRAVDDSLKTLKKDVRAQMRLWLGDGGVLDARLIQKWLLERVTSVSVSDAIAMFSKGDMWIDPTKKMSSTLLEAGVCSGHRVYREGFHNGKWMCKGDILAEEVEGHTEKKGSITTHSIQGQTISTGKIFISLFGSFEYAMPYTAISRAVRLEQLVFVA